MTVKISSDAWVFDVHIYGDGSSTSATFNLLELPLGLDLSVGLWSDVKFRAVFVNESVSPDVNLSAVPSLSGSEITLNFINSGSPTSLSNGVRFKFVCQGVR